MPEGQLLGIAWRDEKRAPMIEGVQRDVTVEGGVAGDYRGKPGYRQVTVLSREGWDAACTELGQSVPWTIRRANLLIEGLELKESVGRRIRAGNVLLEITAETDPCHRMDEQVPGLKQAMVADWRGGVCCRVLEGGTIAIGDPVSWD